jgi:peptide/nickel transport system permease protein
MHRFIIERLIQSVVIVVVVSVIVFLFVHASGDPAALLVPEQATAADAANLPESPGAGSPDLRAICSVHEPFLVQ